MWRADGATQAIKAWDDGINLVRQHEAIPALILRKLYLIRRTSPGSTVNDAHQDRLAMRVHRPRGEHGGPFHKIV